MNLQSELEALFDNIRLFSRTENVIGHPLVVGNITIIPILSISFGAGNGAAGSPDANGSGAGAGGKICPIALLILIDENIRLFSLKGQTNLQEITGLIPEILSSTAAPDENLKQN